MAAPVTAYHISADRDSMVAARLGMELHTNEAEAGRSFLEHAHFVDNVFVEYTCSFCSAVFDRRSDGLLHVFNAHGRKRPGLRVICPAQSCGKTFPTEKALARHSLAAHMIALTWTQRYATVPARPPSFVYAPVPRTYPPLDVTKASTQERRQRSRAPTGATKGMTELPSPGSAFVRFDRARSPLAGPPECV